MADAKNTSLEWVKFGTSFNFSFTYGGETKTFLIDEPTDPASSVTDFSNYVAEDYIAFNPGTEDGTFKSYVGVYYDDSIKGAYIDGTHGVRSD